LCCEKHIGLYSCKIDQLGTKVRGCSMASPIIFHLQEVGSNSLGKRSGLQSVAYYVTITTDYHGFRE
jgi:hypothetical protein